MGGPEVGRPGTKKLDESKYTELRTSDIDRRRRETQPILRPLSSGVPVTEFGATVT